jgi:ferredoxin
MPAAQEEVQEAIDEGVEFSFLAAPTRVISQDGKVLLENIKMKLGAEDASGRRRPEPVKGSEYTVELDNVIAAISQNVILPAGFKLAGDKSGRITADKDTLATGTPGVYAAGDSVLGPATVIEGIAQGRKAAESIDRYLGGNGDISEKLAVMTEVPDRDCAPLAGIRPERPMIAHEKRLHTFEGVEIGWSKEEAERECARCLRCDVRYPVTKYQLDGGLCIYCGLCVEACPFEALFMGTDYERWSYRFGERLLQKEDLATPERRQKSGYAHAEIVKDLPEQSLLLNAEQRIVKKKKK